MTRARCRHLYEIDELARYVESVNGQVPPVNAAMDLVHLARALLALLPVIRAAEEWRAGRDRNIVGTAPSGGQRSETGRALIDAIDAMRAAMKGE